jgi:hypothetical protein
LACGHRGDEVALDAARRRLREAGGVLGEALLRR